MIQKTFGTLLVAAARRLSRKVLDLRQVRREIAPHRVSRVHPRLEPADQAPEIVEILLCERRKPVRQGREPPPFVIGHAPGVGGERLAGVAGVGAERVELAAEAVDVDSFLSHDLFRLRETGEAVGHHEREDEGRQPDQARMRGVGELVLERGVLRPALEP